MPCDRPRSTTFSSPPSSVWLLCLKKKHKTKKIKTSDIYPKLFYYQIHRFVAVFGCLRAQVFLVFFFSSKENVQNNLKKNKQRPLLDLLKQKQLILN